MQPNCVLVLKLVLKIVQSLATFALFTYADRSGDYCKL